MRRDVNVMDDICEMDWTQGLSFCLQRRKINDGRVSDQTRGHNGIFICQVPVAVGRLDERVHKGERVRGSQTDAYPTLTNSGPESSGNG